MAGLLVLALLALILGLGLRFDPLVYLFYVLVGIFLANRLWLRRSMRALRAHRRLGDSSAASDSSAFLGDRLEVTLAVENSGLLPVAWTALTENLPGALRPVGAASWTLSLGPRERRTLRYTLFCANRGYYPIGPLLAAGGTPWEAERNDIELARLVYLTVYPHIVPLGALGLPSRLPLGARRSKSPLLPDPSRLVGVRDYAPGDRLRDIHWRATARLGTLQVKKFEPSQPLQVALFLDLDAAAYDFRTRDRASELAIVVAASLAAHIVEERQAVGLITNGRDPLADDAARAEPEDDPAEGDQAAGERLAVTTAAPPTGPPPAPDLIALPATDRLTAAPAATLAPPARRVLTTDPSAPLSLPEETYDEDAFAYVDGAALAGPPAPPIMTPIHDGRGHLAVLLTILARITLREGPSERPGVPVRTAPLPFSRLVRRRAAGLAWGTTVILITAAPGPNLLPTMLNLRKSGFTPLAIFVQPPRLATDLDADTVRAAGFLAWDIYDEARLAHLQVSETSNVNRQT